MTEIFEAWLDGLRDRQKSARILNQLRKLGDGKFGNAKSVGDGVHELRMDFGPGYRAYFINRGDRLILLLCGGDKSSQKRDIARAKEMAKGDFDEDQDEGV
ncbi:type II toxin-antitoxin system RelE/ParE family toxin [Sphingosinicella sp. LHD-64]|uniref:type II toxin-antitoxin system RelE/ParE family toxin n=1 Tax=Sphingosinicella sp. LHD-64 TaxID=3072139 RepID=UPI00280F53CB|nr:type II toxin-antitoxin system RelE/ParE family toxin [Sphingosinicella sp. LHD-64]MDQ8758058.1 type II toxin-antitoxin system RelE/ParE family toxin [Sphingosinicella sp. LHD-64]